LGESTEAIKAYESAIERLQQLVSEDDSNPQLTYDRSKAKGSLGNIYKQRQELDQARRLLQEALRESRSLIAQDPRNLDFVRLSINQQASLANLERAAGKQSEAMSFLQEALKRASEQLDSELPDDELLTAKLQGSMAQLLFAKRDFATIETLLNQSTETVNRLLEKYQDDTEYMVTMADNLNMLGLLYLSTGRMELAKSTLSELIRLRQELANRFPANTLYQTKYVMAINNYGSVLMQNGEAEQAEESWMKGHEAAERLVSLDPDIPYSRALLAGLVFNLAQRRLDQDNVEAAETLAEQGKLELQSVLESKVNDPHFMQIVGEQHVVFARLYSALGRHEDAIEQTAYLQEHPFHPIQSPILIAKIHAKATIAANESSDGARAEELKSKALKELRLAAKRGFKQWDSLEDEPALMQLFSQEDFAAIRSPE
jgi:tetratricopeptide (TPR) repeat protein